MSEPHRAWWRRRQAQLAIGLGLVALLAIGLLWRRGRAIDPALTALVRRGTLTAQLSAAGTVVPAQAITYRSPLASREAEVTFLVPEGTRVGEGDLLVRLDTTELQRELERTAQEIRQTQVDLQVAEIDRQEGQAAVDSFAEGENAISVDESRTKLQAAQKRADRLKEEFDGLKPLMDKGFITKEELRKTADELEAAQADLALAKRRADVFIGKTHPQDLRRAELQLAQKNAQRENVKSRVLEVQGRFKQLQDQIENCSMYARMPGLVVYEMFLGASPQRKVRVGNHVTGSQGLVTIPDVTRMLVQASVSEADVHRLTPGLAASIRLEAFPDLKLSGRVVRVGTLAQSAADRPAGEKRFDLVIAIDSTDADLRPEMSARADVVLGERQNVLLVPANAVFDQQGTLVCHVVGTLGIETRQVQIGETNDLFVEIAAGLTEGERVALTEEGGGASSAGASGSLPASRAMGPRGAGSGLGPR